MSWLHSDSLQRDEVDAKLKEAGGDNGTFLVRKRPEAGQWVLSVTYKGKPTHHLCKEVGGKIHVMNKNLANASTIEDMVKTFSKKPLPPGWPVQLVLACNVDGSTGAPSSGGGGASAKKSSVRKSSAAGSVKAGAKPWLHAGMPKEKASELLASKSSGTDGAFFVRPRGKEYPDDYVVAVIYKGKPTHHLATKGDGVVKINNKPTAAKNVTQLVALLRKKQPFWPIPLDEYVKKGGTGTGKLSEAKKAAAAPKEEAGGDDEGDDEGGDGDEWLFPAMSKEDAQAKLSEAGLSELGNFMVRTRGPDNPNDYVICVIYKGKPTHHLCVKDGGEYKINKKACGGATNIQDVVAFLRKKQAFWPCPLNEHAKNPKAAPKKKKVSAKKTVKKKEPEPEPEPEVPAVPLTPEEQKAKDIADAAAAIKKAEEDAAAAIKEAEEKKAAEKAARLLADPHKLWIDGKKHDVKIIRTDLSKGFGFGLASKFRIEGRAKVISYVDPKGPAHGVLEIGDEILAICDEPIFELELEDLKELIRDMEISFEARIFRPAKLVATEAPLLVYVKKEGTVDVTPARAKVRATAGSVWEIYGKGKAGDVALDKRAMEITTRISARLTRSAAGKIMAPTVVLNQLGVHNGIADTMV